VFLAESAINSSGDRQGVLVERDPDCAFNHAPDFALDLDLDRDRDCDHDCDSSPALGPAASASCAIIAINYSMQARDFNHKSAASLFER
jgi:hypothetical protein